MLFFGSYLKLIYNMRNNVQAVFLGSNDRHLIVTVSTENDWRESFTSTRELPLNQWAHVVCRCNAKKKTLSVFFDGQLDKEFKLSSPAKINSHPFYIGNIPEGVIKKSSSNPIKAARALVQDMRLYVRTLSDAEIEQLHADFAPQDEAARSDQGMKLAQPIPSVSIIRKDELNRTLEQASKVTILFF